MRNCAVSKMSIVAIHLIVLCSLIFASSFAWANDGDRPCSNRTLSGDYGDEAKGFLLPAPGVSIEFGTLGPTHFNGKGGMTSLEYTVIGGSPAAPGWTPTSGNYSVNPDCTGTATVNTPFSPVPLHLHLLIVNNGKEVFAVLNAHAILTTYIKVESGDHHD
jgi:hypothetical protein